MSKKEKDNRMKNIIRAAGIIILAVTAGFICILYGTGKEMSAFRCGCHK